MRHAVTETCTSDTRLSPVTWRYGSDEMRRLWSEVHKRRLWRRIWVALAAAQAEAGFVSQAQLDDLRAHRDQIDIERAHAIEREIRHDLMAEIKTYAEQCAVGGGIIHLGATSMDIEDNADALRIRESLDLLLGRLRVLLLAFCERIEAEADHVCMAWTHLQPAEPTTVGYRLALYAQDLAAVYAVLRSVRDDVRGKGLKGAVGTSASYAELPGKTAPYMNATVNWKNDANTFGVIVQGFTEKRYVRRDSASRFAYSGGSGWDVINTATMKGITDESLAGTGYTAADLNGVRIPGSMSMEFVEGVRDRKGGLVSLQFKPSSDLDITATGFHTEMDSNNFGRLNAGAMFSMLLGRGGAQGGAAPTSSNGQQVYAQIRNPVIVNETTMYGHPLKVLKSADIMYPDGTTPQYIGETEGAYRDGAKSSSQFLDLDAKYRVNSDLTVKALLSTTKGVGQTGLDQGLTYTRYGTGVSYALGDVNDAPFVQWHGTGPNVPGRNADGSGFALTGRAASGVKTTDKEYSVALDAEYRLDKGVFQSLETGVRYADHDRVSARRFPQLRSSNLSANAPSSTDFIPYPSDFGDGLDGPAGWDNMGWTLSPEQLKAYFAANAKVTSPEWERRVSSELDLRERQTSAYVMANLEADRWSGNMGLRFVRTEVNAMIPTPIPVGLCERAEPGKPAIPCEAVPGAISTASDGVQYYDGVPFNPRAGVMYYKSEKHKVFNDLLPSLNLRYEISKDMIARFGASKTIGRQNYNIIGGGYGSPTCRDGACTVTGPNPNLEPLIARNFDASWAWYFAPRSMVGVNVFHSNIDGYAKTGVAGSDRVDLLDPIDRDLARAMDDRQPDDTEPHGDLVGRVDGIVGSWDLTMKHKPVWTWPQGLRLSRFFSAVH